MLTLSSLVGGLGLFLLGMWLMTEGLKVTAGRALRSILETWTQTRFRGLLAGIAITAIVQSSSAVTVATVGFVNAGLLSLPQAISVVYGTNIGTTMTGWLVALVGVKIDVGALALPLLGVGMLLRLAGADVMPRLTGAGQAIAGFGAFFLGVGTLSSTFSDLSPDLLALDLDDGAFGVTLAFVLLGAILTALTQSSSAAIAIALTASAGGGIPLYLAAATVVGTNIGTTSTALFASIGATPAARRVATAHIFFNLTTGVVAILLMPALVALSVWLVRAVSAEAEPAAILAVFHTIFNCIGVAIIWPLTPRFVRWLSSLYIERAEEFSKPHYLDPTLASVPSVAIRGLVLEVVRMHDRAASLAFRQVTQSEPQRMTHSELEGVLALGQAIRDFIGSLNRGPLPNDVVLGLSDLIRAVQHIEELATLSSELTQSVADRKPEGVETEWQRLWEDVVACLSPDCENNEHGDADLQQGTRIERVESAYQDVKNRLLQQAASGRLSVLEMEQHLNVAQHVRRIAEARFKTQRRLQPILNGIARDRGGIDKNVSDDT